MGKISATKITGPRKIPGDGLGMHHYDIEWTHSDGHFQHTIEEPVYGPKGPPDITFKTVPGEIHPVLKDMVTLSPHGKTAAQIKAELDALVEQKRAALEEMLPKHQGLSIVAPSALTKK